MSGGKQSLGSNAFLYPMPVVLVGTLVDGKPNFMTVGWVSRVNFKPPLLAIAVNHAHHTAAGVRQSGTFSVNIPSMDMIEATDYCGLVSGRSTDKSALFEVFYGATESAPMIAQCPLNIECRLHQTVDLPSNHLFIGEIIEAYAEPRFLKDGRPDIKTMNPFVLTMPDNGYWAVGERLAQAWSVGKQLKKA
ncbi:MAG: flavin reductase family protein [Syntrophobacteraceae bacterium]|jgi:flavin reductase (DIM6/NTAB) family NADH-FMN oxidoreductase RutF|nr:flavin reductase family protein [Syntrophobacteraceae bacterium]